MLNALVDQVEVRQQVTSDVVHDVVRVALGERHQRLQVRQELALRRRHQRVDHVVSLAQVGDEATDDHAHGVLVAAAAHIVEQQLEVLAQ